MPKTKPSTPPRGPNGQFMRRTAAPAMPMVIRKPFTDPVPLQDQLSRRFGPARPVPATQQLKNN